MKHSYMAAVILASGLLVAPMGAGGASPESKSAQAFVQDFYTWYGQEEKKDHGMDLSDYAIKMKPQLFSAAIVRGLEEDEAAQDKVPDEIVGIDFDPITSAQDVCNPYKVGKVKVVSGHYQVEIYGQGCDSKPAKPQVIAVVEKQKGAWVFVNFIYPYFISPDRDLFSVLRSLKKGRESPDKGK